MRSILPLLALAATVVGSPAGGAAASPAAPPGAAELPRRLDALFAGLHAAGRFDGAVVVGRGSQVVWEAGYGLANRDLATPFTPDTPADGGSLAKTMTAALVLQLAGERRLDLDAPAQALLPELPYPAITMRHLLSHSTGLPGYSWFDAWLRPDEVRTTERLLHVLAERRPPLAFEPGTAFEYDSLGFDLAALAAGRAAGRGYPDLFARRLFAPLGLTSAFLRPGRLADFPAPRTVGYRVRDGRYERHEVFDFESFHGGSNVYLSARDAHRWNAAFLAPALLPPGPLAAALAPARIGGSPSGLTLGSWYRDDAGTAFWYSGHLQAFHDEAFRDLASGWSIAYVSNVTLEPWLQKGIVRAVRVVLAGGDPPPFDPPPVAPVAAAELARLAGAWALPGGEAVAVEVARERPETLHLRVRGVAYRMVQVAPEAFYVPGIDWMVGFARGAGDAVERMYVSSNLDARWAERGEP